MLLEVPEFCLPKTVWTLAYMLEGSSPRWHGWRYWQCNEGCTSLSAGSSCVRSGRTSRSASSRRRSPSPTATGTGRAIGARSSWRRATPSNSSCTGRWTRCARSSTTSSLSAWTSWCTSRRTSSFPTTTPSMTSSSPRPGASPGPSSCLTCTTTSDWPMTLKWRRTSLMRARCVCAAGTSVTSTFSPPADGNLMIRRRSGTTTPSPTRTLPSSLSSETSGGPRSPQFCGTKRRINASSAYSLSRCICMKGFGR